MIPKKNIETIDLLVPIKLTFTRDEYIGVWYVGYVDNTVEDVVKVMRKSDRTRNKKKPK